MPPLSNRKLSTCINIHLQNIYQIWKHKNYYSLLLFRHPIFIYSTLYKHVLYTYYVPATFLSSVQFSCSVVSDSLWPHEPQHTRPPCLSPTPGVHPNPCPLSRWWDLRSNHLILCCPLLLLPSIFPSIRVFSTESALCIRWLKYWSFSFNISPFNEHPGLISFRMDWLDLLAV